MRDPVVGSGIAAKVRLLIEVVALPLFENAERSGVIDMASSVISMVGALKSLFRSSTNADPWIAPCHVPDQMPWPLSTISVPSTETVTEDGLIGIEYPLIISVEVKGIPLIPMTCIVRGMLIITEAKELRPAELTEYVPAAVIFNLSIAFPGFATIRKESCVVSKSD